MAVAAKGAFYLICSLCPAVSSTMKDETKTSYEVFAWLSQLKCSAPDVQYSTMHHQPSDPCSVLLAH